MILTKVSEAILSHRHFTRVDGSSFLNPWREVMTKKGVGKTQFQSIAYSC